MIELREILSLIDQHIEKTGEKDAQLSRRVTGSTDTIRNWRRAYEAGKESTATFAKVQDVLDAMGYELLLSPNGMISTDQEILMALEKIEGLGERGREIAFAVISNHVTVNRQTKSSHIDDRDQSSSANGHRASSPSR